MRSISTGVLNKVILPAVLSPLVAALIAVTVT
jgi:hypothetical protein